MNRGRPSVGDTLPTFVDQPLTVEDFVRYQGASGDFNPVHYDTAFAAAAGFPQPFAVGMRQAGVAANWLTDTFGAAGVGSFDVSWRAQAWPGEALRYEGTVTAVDDAGVHVDYRVVRPDGTVHAHGTATLTRDWS